MSRTWMVGLVLAGGFLLASAAVRVQRVDQVSSLAGAAPAVDASSPTGYAGGRRQLLVPERNTESYQWIATAQQMLAQGEGRVRRVTFDNAPVGREVHTPSVYRWWLGAVAWLDHTLSGRPLGQSVERAALWADPLAHLLLLISAVGFVARRFGNLPAALLALGLVGLFPLGAAFLPGQPDDLGLSLACAWWSVLPLLAALRAPGAAGPAATRTGGGPGLWILAGVAGGLGLWVNVAAQAPVLAGVALGGLVSVLGNRRRTDAVEPTSAGWRAWALSGAMTTLVAYLLEYAPAHLGGFRLQFVHPLWALVWLGAGEWLASAATWAGRTTTVSRVRLAGGLALGLVLMATLPLARAFLDTSGTWWIDPLATRLSNVADSPVAANLGAWIGRDGFKLTALGLMLPLALLLVAGGQLWRGAAAISRTALALALGPLVLALVFGGWQLRWWSVVDVLLLVLLVGLTTEKAGKPRRPVVTWAWIFSALLVVTPSLVQLWPRSATAGDIVVTEAEVQSLVERDLAHWLATRAGGPGGVVLAPPALTASLFYFGGLPGLGTPYLENEDGFAAAVRIAAATSPDEAQALARRREIKYVVMPSWDPFLDEYARLGANQPENSLVGLLHRWTPPRWLRPVAYAVPEVAGFEGQSATIFEVVDVQENAVALSRLAEYFVETRRLDLATSLGAALEQYFPDELVALVARARVAAARQDGAAFKTVLTALEPYLSGELESGLPWDGRVSLVIVLAQAKRVDQAKAQLQLCWTDLDETHLRSLSTTSLYRITVLAKAWGMKIEDPGARAVAKSLLPVAFQGDL